jgi:hypothetical protein
MRDVCCLCACSSSLQVRLFQILTCRITYTWPTVAQTEAPADLLTYLTHTLTHTHTHTRLYTLYVRPPQQMPKQTVSQIMLPLYAQPPQQTYVLQT